MLGWRLQVSYTGELYPWPARIFAGGFWGIIKVWNLQAYHHASSAAEAVALMQQQPGRGCYIAGGTDLLLDEPDYDFAVDISGAGLDSIESTPDGGLFIGATATLETILHASLLRSFASGALADAAAHCANRPVRSVATIGGNLCNALPSADMAPVLLALDARLHLSAGDTGGAERVLPLSEFFLARRRTLLDGALLLGLSLPASAAGRRAGLRKLTRSKEDIALVHAAVALDLEDRRVMTARIALGSVAPTPLLVPTAAAALIGQELVVSADGTPGDEATAAVIAKAADAAALACSPIDDHRAAADYRRAMVTVLVRRLILALAAPASDTEDTTGRT